MRFALSLLNCWSWRRPLLDAAFTRPLSNRFRSPSHRALPSYIGRTCIARQLGRLMRSKTHSVANSFSTPSPEGKSVLFPLKSRSCLQRLASSFSPRHPLACCAAPLPVTVTQPHKRRLLRCCSLLQRAAAIAGGSAPCTRAAPHPAPSSRPWTEGGVGVLDFEA